MDAKTTTPFEDLDNVLNIFSFGNKNILRGKQVYELYTKEYNSVSGDYLNGLVEKLVSDKYLKLDMMPDINEPLLIEFKYYSLTLEGSLFKAAGGYQQQEKDLELDRAIKQSELARSNRINKNLVFATYLAGAGAILLFGWEIYKFYYLHIR